MLEVVFESDPEVGLDRDFSEHGVPPNTTKLLAIEAFDEVKKGAARLDPICQHRRQVHLTEVTLAVRVELELRLSPSSHRTDAGLEAFSLAGFEVRGDVAKGPVSGTRLWRLS